MKLSTREDINAPIGEVYRAVTNFAQFERQLERRGVSILRHDPADGGALGRRWSAKAEWRGRAHDIEAELVKLEEGRGYSVESRSGGVIAMTVVDLVALSKTRTRLLLSIDLRPTGLSSRLIIQSLKLAKSRLEGRLKTRLEEFARKTEQGGT